MLEGGHAMLFEMQCTGYKANSPGQSSESCTATAACVCQLYPVSRSTSVLHVTA